ncbi:30S ribosomal protein S9 [Candidatus Woesearchaeota archaeon]|nr:30S ribosomal protein S9 [Candidatus Woesearchaeota archaeon]
MKKQTVVQTVGKRKRAIARATLKPGQGIIKINNYALETFNNELFVGKIKEVLILAGEDAVKYDIKVSVDGGGFTGQADAIRLAIGKALVEANPKLKDVFLRYNRNFLVADTRRKEVRKPNCAGKARSKVQKSYR